MGVLGPTLEPWRMLSAVFVHLGVLHLVMNMSALAWLGRAIEGSLGSWRMIAIFVISGLAGFYLSCLYYGPGPPTAGASGAIFGLVGAQLAEDETRTRSTSARGVLAVFGLCGGVRPDDASQQRRPLEGSVVGYLLTQGLVRVPRRVAWDRIGRPVAYVLWRRPWRSQVAAALSLHTRAVSAFRPHGS